MGGAYSLGDELDQGYSHLQVFDFTKLCWVATPFDDMNLPCRRGHMAACHNDAVFVMGGEHDPGFLSCDNRGAYGGHVQNEGICSVLSARIQNSFPCVVLLYLQLSLTQLWVSVSDLRCQRMTPWSLWLRFTSMAIDLQCSCLFDLVRAYLIVQDATDNTARGII